MSLSAKTALALLILWSINLVVRVVLLIIYKIRKNRLKEERRHRLEISEWDAIRDERIDRQFKSWKVENIIWIVVSVLFIAFQTFMFVSNL